MSIQYKINESAITLVIVGLSHFVNLATDELANRLPFSELSSHAEELHAVFECQIVAKVFSHDLIKDLIVVPTVDVGIVVGTVFAKE